MKKFTEYLAESTEERVNTVFKWWCGKLAPNLNMTPDEVIKWMITPPVSQDLHVTWDWRYYHDIWHVILHGDPTREKKYLMWLAKMSLLPAPNRLQEDMVRITDALTTFERIKHILPVERRDINSFKTYRELETLMDANSAHISNRQYKKGELEQIQKEIKVVYQDGSTKISIPQTEDAARYLGRDTKWCTAYQTKPTYFDQYNKMGPLFVIEFINGDAKLQYHAPSYRWVTQTQGDGFDYPHTGNPTGAIDTIRRWIHLSQLANKYDHNAINMLSGHIATNTGINALLQNRLYAEFFIPLLIAAGQIKKAEEVAEMCGGAIEATVRLAIKYSKDEHLPIYKRNV